MWRPHPTSAPLSIRSKRHLPIKVLCWNSPESSRNLQRTCNIQGPTCNRLPRISGSFGASAHLSEAMRALDKFLAECRRSVLEGDKALSAELARETLDQGYDPLRVIDQGFSIGVRDAGKLWEQGHYFLPELAFAAEAMKAAMAILQPVLLGGGGDRRKGRVLMGTVQGDIHDIGKSLVTTLLLANNYEVIDLGSDVPYDKFVAEVASLKPDFIGMSALLTTTMAGQSEVIKMLTERGLRNSVRVLVGGAPTTPEWAEEIGADGHGENAVAAVALADALSGAD